MGEGLLRPRDDQRLAQAARLHHQDLPARAACTSTTATSAAPTAWSFLGVDDRHGAVRHQQPEAACETGASIVLYLPKIQTAEEAALWNDMITALERHLGLPVGTVKVYVLVEQLETVFQLMEIRAALTPHFIGFNTGRWDYINSVADALAWDPSVHQSQHRRDHDDLRLHAELRIVSAGR